LGGRYS